ncbi:MAG TPA: adhesion protein, partial [Clostridium sp.]|nr:adhesion protein [Clostridium sp.]
MKRVRILGTLILLIITLAACSNKNSKDNVHNDEEIKVVTSFYGMKA